MSKSLTEIKAAFPSGRRAKIESRAVQIMAEHKPTERRELVQVPLADLPTQLRIDADELSGCDAGNATQWKPVNKRNSANSKSQRLG